MAKSEKRPYRRPVRPAVLCAVAAALCVGVSPVHAQTRTQGSNLAEAADGGFGCETAWSPGFTPPDFAYEPFATGHTTCTTFMPGVTINDTFLVPGDGTVRRVRVKSGPTPAPLRIAIIRRLFQTNPNNPNEITDAQCCTGVRESATFNPRPNAVTEVTVNLPVDTEQSINGASGWHDIVAVSAVGAGQLPIASVGPHTAAAGTQASTPTAHAYYPKIEPGRANNNTWSYPNWVVLMAFDWAAPGEEIPNGPGAATITSKSLKLRKGKVAVRVRCDTTTGARCKGKVRLRTRAKKPKLLASKSINIRDRKTAKVTLKLSGKARRRVPRKRNRVSLTVNLGGHGKTTKKLILKR